MPECIWRSWPARGADGAFVESNSLGFVMRSIGILQALAFLIAATVVEVSGDAIVRIALHNYTGLTTVRIGLFILGAALVFGYATFLNLAPLEFREVVGLYIATLFVVWQIINFAFFRTLPTIPNLIGGALILAGGLLVSFWKQ
jgi:small multidrug resistance family-3 protein